MYLSIPSPSINSISLGPLEIRFYALFIVAGIIVAWWIADRRYVRRGGPEEVSIDVAVWMVLFGIVGARIYHVITTPDPYFGPNGDPLKALRIWEGGLGIWGGVALGALGGFIALHRRGLRFAPFADAAVPGVLVAQGIGRFGNYFNQELFGKPTDLPWALEIDDSRIPPGFAPGTTFHPTFLYEALWVFAMAGLLIWLERRFRFRGGQTALMYIILYTAGRVWIENLRIDEAQIIAGLRLNVWTSIIVLVCAVIAFVALSRYLNDRPELADIYLPGHGPADADDTAEPADDLASTEGDDDTGTETETDRSDTVMADKNKADTPEA
ncbi:prolipoprotein diacylglyceryl transferase [Trueperella bialowiezensis]|uniref:Phosphatidylglycerol--prolipoprotein diacylglyceryl transferase n=1 Tax=Trueperella bialowiezensis TaxID=312285 RepID=A0A3S4VEG4_9ACTO|nr:prolipoprotein diacylglyceryl transferase [Trueperella bialowiezensis]VEI12389.1 Prolipoprotein diacylglyceryl transferase [Trueperella bialowiezensis]